MFIKKKSMCKNCLTGKETYLLDEHSPFCPYIGGYVKNKCAFYKPIKRKWGIFKKFKK